MKERIGVSLWLCQTAAVAVFANLRDLRGRPGCEMPDSSLIRHPSSFSSTALMQNHQELKSHENRIT